MVVHIIIYWEWCDVFQTYCWDGSTTHQNMTLWTSSPCWSEYLHLFMFRPIASKQLNSLTTIILSVDWLEVMCLFGCERSRVQFRCLIYCFVVVEFLLFCPKTHYFSPKFAISFAMLIYIVYIAFWQHLWPIIRV